MNAPKQETEIPEDLIDVKHASRLAKIHVSGVYRWIGEKKLRAWNRLGRVFVSQADVLALFKPIGKPVLVMPSKRARRRDEAWADEELRRQGVKVGAR